MLRYAITHGLRNGGFNPEHTAAGIAQLRNLVVPQGITNIVLGTGERFEEIFAALFHMNEPPFDDNPNRPKIWYSPFVGSADGFDPPDRVILGHRDDGNHRSCRLADYIGVANARAFDAWAFVGSLPEGTLFLTGGEFMLALGVEKPSKGALYWIDSKTKAAPLLTQQG